MMCFKDSINGFASGNLRKGFPGGSDGKESACHAGDPSSIPGLGRSAREGNGNTHTHTHTHTHTQIC